MKMGADHGDSLLEVIISTVIMGIIGVLLVSSVAVARPFADKMSLVGQTVQNLNSLAESINLQPYTPCSQAHSEPYSFAQVTNKSISDQTVFGIANVDLPPVMVSTSGDPHSYNAQLVAAGASGPVTWQVEPLLPAGLSLDSNTGIISGTTSQPITATYDFTATSGNSKVIKSLMLTSALVEVLENEGSSWVPCGNIPVDTISYVAGDGTAATYTYSGPAVQVGSTLSVWGTGDKNFDGASMQVTSATANSFTASNPNVGYAYGGFANIAAEASVQQVVVSTVAAGSPFHKVITKAMQ